MGKTVFGKERGFFQTERQTQMKREEIHPWTNSGTPGKCDGSQKEDHRKTIIASPKFIRGRFKKD